MELLKAILGINDIKARYQCCLNCECTHKLVRFNEFGEGGVIQMGYRDLHELE